MTIENVSKRIISLSPDKSILPEEKAVIDDDVAVAVQPYIAIGFLKVVPDEKPEPKAEVAEPAEALKKSKKRKAE